MTPAALELVRFFPASLESEVSADILTDTLIETGGNVVEETTGGG